MIKVSVQQADFDVGEELSLLKRDVGALSSFVGIVRGQDGLVSLTLEHYPAMTAQVLNALAEQAAQRWSLTHITLIHRVGILKPDDQIVLVATGSSHRSNALESCAFLIDRLKTDAPFWKKECFSDGRDQWVETRHSDTQAAARWMK